MLTTKRVSQGRYTVTVHGYTFTIERLYGDRNWRLYNALDTEVNYAETKQGLLTGMAHWSVDHAKTNAEQEFCTYA